MKGKKLAQKGFTLVELLLVMGVFAILSSLVTINLLRPQIKASVDKSVNTLIADIKLQQIKSMVGDNLNNGTADSHGIYFGTNEYTLFKGTTYTVGNSSNIVIPLDEGNTFSTINLPDSQIIFSRLSGEFSNYVSVQNRIIVGHSQGVTSTQITIN